MKAWYQSKMLWLGAAAVLTAVGGAVTQGADWRTIVIAAIGGLVMFLRTQTTQAIRKGKK